MEVTFEAAGDGTQVNILFRDIPNVIRPEDNEAGTEQTLEKLARYLKSKEKLPGFNRKSVEHFYGWSHPCSPGVAECLPVDAGLFMNITNARSFGTGP